MNTGMQMLIKTLSCAIVVCFLKVISYKKLSLIKTIFFLLYYLNFLNIGD